MALDVGAETGHVLAVVLVRIIMLIPEREKNRVKSVFYHLQKERYRHRQAIFISEPRALKNYIRMKAAFCKIL